MQMAVINTSTLNTKFNSLDFEPRLSAIECSLCDLRVTFP